MRRDVMISTAPSLWRAAIFLLAAGLAYVFYTGLICSDDTRYLTGIQKIAAGNHVDINSPAEKRLFFMLPGALVYKLFGSIDATIGIYSIFYLALPLIAWRMLRGQGLAIQCLGSGLGAVSPLLYFNAGMLLPDIISAFLAALAMLLLLEWRLRLHDGCAPSWIPLLIGFVSGFGVATKESHAVIAIMPLGFFAYGVFDRLGWRACAKSAVLFLTGLSVFALVDLLTWHALGGKWNSSLFFSVGEDGLKKFMISQGLYPWERFRVLMSLFDGWTRYTFLAALISTALIAIKYGLRGKKAWYWILPGAFFVWPLLYFTVGSGSLKNYLPPVMQARYYAPCALPAAILLALGIKLLAKRVKFAVAGIGVVLLFAALANVRAKYPERGMQYLARIKEGFTLAISDINRLDPAVPIVYGTSTANDIDRCERILLENSGLKWSEPKLSSSLPEPPFFVMGFDSKDILSSATTTASTINEITAKRELRTDLVGYYYADDAADDKIWWMPRQEAIKHLSQEDKRLFKETAYPSGYVPWLKREMHSELFLVRQ